jgi:hypothetical protein
MESLAGVAYPQQTNGFPEETITFPALGPNDKNWFQYPLSATEFRRCVPA